MLAAPAITKYRFSIRTREGTPVDQLMIPGRDRAEAERKLRQIYRNCDVLDCRLASEPLGTQGFSFEDVIDRVTSAQSLNSTTAHAPSA
jgi:hypothetical protein